MEDITHQTYVNANIRLEELINFVSFEMEDNDPILIEFFEISSIIEAYEKIHFPIGLECKEDFKTIKVKVEKAKDGTYWGTTQNIPGVVTAEGNTLEELKENLKVAIELYVETSEGHDKEIYEKLANGFELETGTFE